LDTPSVFAIAVSTATMAWFTCVAPSGDVKWLFTGCWDCAACVCSGWEQNNGKELCQLFGFQDCKWVMMDPEGRFDAANNGDVEHLHWVVGMETLPLKQFRDCYHDPGLLAKHLGLHKERPREIKAMPR
jgi:hypothetical protein